MIYLDNAATTPISEPVRAAMLPYLTEVFGNPSSIHHSGREARIAVDHARRTIATWLSCDPRDLVFVSGGTEADASALTGAYLARRTTRNHIITSSIEHHAILHTVDFLESIGAEVTRLPVDSEGRVRVEDVLSSLRPDTSIVSIMAVNNELGTIEPVEEIARVVKAVDPAVIVHSDMVQALPFVEHPLRDTSLDLASFSAHKIHGPKGIGLLFVKKHTPWQPTLHGGQQEARRRGGTENVAGIVGFGAAVQDLAEGFGKRREKLYALRDAFYEQISESCSAVRLSPADGAPTILNVAFPGIRNDTLLMRLDLEGLMASAGSACTAGSLEPSHVIAACGYNEYLGQAVRFSFSDQNSIDEVVAAGKIVCRVVTSLQQIL
ncbi:cysteine desulfurase family protein [Alicyclobacillus dauci]|uniref:cysteine desulfurase n=1 Tax=Alicyclobacillus dauci TaxID=1475485 RepID=A0ABY6Z6I7_9BACL|nr:cysteine desulfurase family protein [Alicyclobacillus dauci]WAH38502.1 cysteine desulfurase [Alicyclobacillus dauci]